MSLKWRVIGVRVFLEKYTTRLYAGCLTKKVDQFVFTYDEKYLHSPNIIPLGPELPLTKKQFISKTLFPSFIDRIPSKHNPAYPEYCLATGIDPNEDDPLILLSTIGKRGPSSFIFEPLYERSIYAETVIQFRHSLKLTTREFAEVFEISQAALNALERKRTSGKELLKKLELIILFPEVANYFLTLNGGMISYHKWIAAKEFIKKINEQL